VACLRSILFSIFIDDLDDGIECIPSIFAGISLPGGAIDMLFRETETGWKWAGRNLLKFSIGNCKVLLLGWNSHTQLCRLGDDRLESSSAEKDLGLPVTNKLHTSRP